MKLRKLIALLLIATMVSGCTGSFELTRKVNSFHRTIENKWVDEILFLVFAYLPVYAIAILADAIIFNSIEFWTCENPLKSCQADKATRVVMAGDLKAVMVYDKATDTIKVDAFRGVLPVTSFVLARDNDKVMIKDKDGNVISQSRKQADGSVRVYDAGGRLAGNFSAEAVRLARERRSGAFVYAKK